MEHRTCQRCQRVLPASHFTDGRRARASRPDRSWTTSACADCRREEIVERSRRRRAERRAEVGRYLPEPLPASTSTDPPENVTGPVIVHLAVAVALRVELARRRAAGEPFETAWAPSLALALALADVRPAEAAWWRAVLQRQRPAWRAGYERAGADTDPSLTAALAHAMG